MSARLLQHTHYQSSPCCDQGPAQNRGRCFRQATFTRKVSEPPSAASGRDSKQYARNLSRTGSEPPTLTAARAHVSGDRSVHPQRSSTPATSAAATSVSGNVFSISSQHGASNTDVVGFSQPVDARRRASAPSDSGPEPTLELCAGHHPHCQRLIYRIHADYLGLQSSLFRDVLSEVKKFPREAEGTRTRASEASGKALLFRPTTSNFVPIILLTLPDPYAFSAILHYLYFGNFSKLEKAMDHRLVKWEGVVANAEVLGCDSSFKKQLGKYWRSRVASPK